MCASLYAFMNPRGTTFVLCVYSVGFISVFCGKLVAEFRVNYVNECWCECMCWCCYWLDEVYVRTSPLHHLHQLQLDWSCTAFRVRLLLMISYYINCYSHNNWSLFEKPIDDSCFMGF